MFTCILLCLTDEADNNKQIQKIAGSALVSILVMLEYLSIEVASQHIRLNIFIFLTYI